MHRDAVYCTLTSDRCMVRLLARACSADPTVLREKINFQHFACVMARFRRIKEGDGTGLGYNSVDQKVECE